MAGALKNRRMKIREMEKTFESFEWLIKDKLVGLDNVIRAMQTEMQTLGAPRAEMDAFIPLQFERLWNEVAKDQAERYDKGGKTA